MNTVQINGMGDSLLVAVVGILVVFFGLVILIMLIKLMGLLTGNMGKKAETKAAPAIAPAAAPVAAPAVVKPLLKADAKIKSAKIDAQTVAVLTAAIAATRGEGYPFKIRRIVRVNKR